MAFELSDEFRVKLPRLAVLFYFEFLTLSIVFFLVFMQLFLVLICESIPKLLHPPVVGRFERSFDVEREVRLNIKVLRDLLGLLIFSFVVGAVGLESAHAEDWFMSCDGLLGHRVVDDAAGR